MQSRLSSFIEQWGRAMTTWLLSIPVYLIALGEYSWKRNIGFSVYMLCQSVAIGYLWRRYFEKKKINS